MTNMVESVPVEVNVQSFSKLFGETTFPLAVDTYQRGFVWNDEKVRQLADDLVAYQTKNIASKLSYYMGTILIHRSKDKQKHFIIDGQQRLTALCLLCHRLNGNLPSNCELTYSPKSARRIRAVADVFQASEGLPMNNIFEQIAFTVIHVDRVDLAFTFFDTQNNRGVPLDATDLLKAYHLRAVGGDEPVERIEALQKLCAQRWEGIQQGSPVMSHDREFAQSLFTKFLWRSRYWTGQRVVYGGHDELMEEFQKRTLKLEDDKTTIPIYPSRHNRLGTALTVNRDGHSEIHTNRISLSPKAKDLPFTIRQPIHKGIGFFLYADKYAALLRYLMVESNDSDEIIRFRKIYTELMMSNSLFLREIFLLASLMYIDQFGEAKLWAFSLWLEYALGAIRMEKQQVRYESAQNFFKKGTLNLLDVIASSYRPEQVIDHLKSDHTCADNYANENIKTGNGVQGVYKQAVLAYFERMETTSLLDKHVWITAKLNRF